MLTSLSIEKKILLSVGILVAGYVASAGIVYFSGEVRERELEAVGERSVPVALMTQSALFEFESGAKAYTDAVLTGDQESLATVAGYSARVGEALAAVAANASFVGLEPAALESLSATIKNLDSSRLKVFAALAQSGDEAARAEAQKLAEALQNSTAQARNALTALSKSSTEALNQQLRHSIDDTRRQRILNAAGAGLIILLGGGAVFIVVRRAIVLPSERITQGLSATSNRVDEAAASIRAASQQLADGASEQAASLEETSATLEEISSVAKRNADSSLAAKQKATAARDSADQGIHDVKQMRDAMAEIKTASDNIAKIVKTIDEIAFQTNLLALNAAVEAARAGEAGAGFGVVAEEVRALAQRSAIAARETAQLISDSVSKSERGVVISGQVAGGLETIALHIREVDTLVGEIANASEEQSRGVSEVNKAVVRLNTTTQANAATAEESSATVEELNGRAIELRQFTEQLEHTIHGLQASKVEKTEDRASVVQAGSPRKAIVRA